MSKLSAPISVVLTRRTLSATTGLMLLIGIASSASGQSESGSLKGFVTDQSGGALHGVTVSVIGPP